jgi:hypothetical protein
MMNTTILKSLQKTAKNCVTMLRLSDKRYIKIILLAGLLFCFMQNKLFSANISDDSEDRLLALFVAGETDSLREVINTIPEETAAGQFFRGIYEIDGEAARFYFDRTVALYPGSQYSAYALNRLWQYHMAKGDFEMAERYYGFLERRHPDHHILCGSPDPLSIQDLTELSKQSASSIPHSTPNSNYSAEMWTVQLGAYKNPKGAQKVGQTAQKWGDVRYIKKVFKGKELTVVQVGLFDDRDKAVNLDSSIRATTDLRGRIVKVQQ